MGAELGGIEEGETVVKVYHKREDSIFKTNKQTNGEKRQKLGVPRNMVLSPYLFTAIQSSFMFSYSTS